MSPSQSNHHAQKIKTQRVRGDLSEREERTDLIGGEVCAGIEGSGGGAERLDDGNERLGGGGGDELTGGGRQFQRLGRPLHDSSSLNTWTQTPINFRSNPCRERGKREKR
ncbi:hypothetical protein Bca4012_036437 [Brassica carinata]